MTTRLSALMRPSELTVLTWRPASSKVKYSDRPRVTPLDVKGKSTYILDQDGRVDYTYDAGSRLTDMKVEGETSSTFGYDANSNRTSYIQANGVKTGYGYDDDNRLATKGYGSYQ